MGEPLCAGAELLLKNPRQDGQRDVGVPLSSAAPTHQGGVWVGWGW